MTEASPEMMQIAEVPGYRIERVLGRGGFGTVLAALAPDGARVALKVANSGDAVAAAHLAREEKALRAVGPRVAPAVHGSARLPDGSPYLALELLNPPTLAQRLREVGGPMERIELAARAATLCDAVAAVHTAGYLHLDLKPENVFLTTSGVRLIDFGLARPINERHEPTGAFGGTPEYASPEQCEERSDLDVRSDVYGLGVILFEMATGRPPFTGEAKTVREAHIGLRPPRPSQFTRVPVGLEQVVLRALAKDRTRRYASAAELNAAMQTVLAEDLPAERGTRGAVAPAQPRLERRQVGLLLFASSSDAGSVQAAVRSLGGELGWAGRGRYAAIFPAEAGQDPVRRAFRAAQGLAERKLAVRALVDVGAVNTQRRADGQVRYLAPELGREDRYVTDADPVGPLATAAAVAVLADVEWEIVPGRTGILVPRPGTADRLQTATVIQLGAGPLVGREDVVRDLLAAAKEAVQGVPAAMTVIAEPGHGKTHLAAALLEKLRSHVPVAELLDVRAREPLAGDADETLRALLSRALELPAEAGEESARARFAALVGADIANELWPAAALTLRLVSPDVTRVRSLAAAPGVLRSMAMRAVGEALRARARHRPVCLVLDDAQFADETALDALEYAALAEAKAPLFICALGRPSFAEARRSFGERAARQTLHRLGPLEPERAAELCRRLLAPAENVPQGAIDLLVQRTQGIPLLLVELVRGLKRDGLVRKRMRGETWFLATDELERLPDSPLIEWLAERELGALAHELASHARLVALLGIEFGAEEVDGIVVELEAEGLGNEFPLDAQVATRRLVGLGLLIATRAGGFRFRHSLVRDAVARSVPSAKRGRLHQAAARFYRTTRVLPDVRRLPLLARHAAQAGLKEEAATLYLELAGEARARHAYLDAERSYTGALESLPPADLVRRVAAQHGRGSTRYRIGRYEDAFADLAEARLLAQQLGDRTLEADILLDASTALDWTNEFTRSRDLVDQAEALAREEFNELLRAKLVLGKGRALFRVGQRSEACKALEQASSLAERSGDEAYETLIISLVILVLLLPELGRIDDAERISARAIALARERGDRLHLAAAFNNRRNILIARKDVLGACNEQKAFMQIGRELGIVTTEYVGEFNLCELLYLASELDAAVEHARRAIKLESRHPEVASQGPLAVLLLARIEAYRGHEARARELLDEVRRIVVHTKGELPQSDVLTPSEEVLCDMVDLATREATQTEWQVLLERSSRDSVEQEPIEVADLYGTWALRRGRMDEAQRAFAEAARRAARIPNIMDRRVQQGLAATAPRVS
jgi:tetratricopeptide (TPR) repeat protein